MIEPFECGSDADEPDDQVDAMGALAESFIASHRQGLHPCIEDYCVRFPELATRIRDLFPTLLLVEQLDVGTSPASATNFLGKGTVPTKIGDFEILREIGRGGMGIVYEAVQQSLGRRVALKVLPSSTSLSSSTIERFRRESRAAARLHHSNIVPVFGVGEDDSLLYYVMQCIQGVGLDQVLAELIARENSPRLPEPHVASKDDDQLSIDDAIAMLFQIHGDVVPSSDLDRTVELATDRSAGDGAQMNQPDTSTKSLLNSAATAAERRSYWHRIARIGLQVADALEYALSQGVLHRDIKPSNLLLDIDGVVWVTDFGLAKVAESEDLTRVGEMLGTLRYLAPERMRGIHDVRGDIYGLGLTLYELLTLQIPFASENKAELTRQILETQPRRPRSIDSRIPVDLETIVQKAIAKAPRDRYQSLQSLADDLRLFLDDRPIKSRRTSYLEHSWRWCRRNPTLASLFGCVGGLIAITIGVLAVSNASIRRETSQKNEALEDKSAALVDREAAYQKLEASELLAKRRFYASQTNLAGLAYHRGEIVRAEDLLESVITQTGEPDFRGFEWFYLRSEMRRGLLPVVRHQGNEIICLSFASDGTRLLCGGGTIHGGTVRLIDVPTGQTLFEIVKSRSCANGCAYAADGSAFAIGYDNGTVQIVRADSFETVGSESTKLLIKSMAWSPDSKLLAIGCEHGQLIVYKMPEFESVTIPTAHQGPILRIAFSRDSKRLFTSADWGGEGVMGRQWNSELWPPAVIKSFPNQAVSDESPDGNKLVAMKWGSVQVIDAHDGQRVEEKLISSGPVVTAKYTSDGTRLLVGARTDRVVRTLDATTLEELGVSAQSHIVSALAVDSTGRYWAAGDTVGDVRTWDTMPASYDAQYENANVKSAFFVSDSQQVVLGGSGESISWSLVDGATNVINQRFGLREISLDGKTWICLKKGLEPGVAEVVEVWREGVNEPVIIPLSESIYHNCLAVSASGRWLTTRFDLGPIKLYDLSVSPSQPAHTLASRCYGIAFSPDERLLVCGEQYGGVGCFDVASGKQMSKFVNFESWWSWGMCVAFSSDSRYVASGNESGTVRVWATDSRQLVSTLTGQPGEVRTIAFFPDGRRLAMGGTGDVQIWDYLSGQELLAIPVKGGHVQSLAINATGDTIIAITPQGTTRAWVGAREKTADQVSEP